MQVTEGLMQGLHTSCQEMQPAFQKGKIANWFALLGRLAVECC